MTPASPDTIFGKWNSSAPIKKHGTDFCSNYLIKREIGVYIVEGNTCIYKPHSTSCSNVKIIFKQNNQGIE